ncbi:MAG: hypothetical protein JNL81_12065 [Hyphomonadaceae bacterium]|nr:hypothetical protein [Hyphomonadaceae bacterium]
MRIAIFRALGLALAAALLFSPRDAAAETLLLECQIEFTVVGEPGWQWARDSEIVRVDMEARTLSVTDAAAMFPDAQGVPCEITAELISCGMRGVPTRRINRYSGAYEMSYGNGDARAFRPGVCRRLTQQF